MQFRYNPLQFSSLNCSAIYSVSLHLNKCAGIKDLCSLKITLHNLKKKSWLHIFLSFTRLCVLRSVYRQILWALTFCKCQHQTHWIHLSYAAHNKQAALHKINVVRG